MNSQVPGGEKPLRKVNVVYPQPGLNLLNLAEGGAQIVYIPRLYGEKKVRNILAWIEAELDALVRRAKCK